MSLTKLDIDRFITTLRTKSKEFNSISNVQLASMLEETISNIKEVAFFWATICSDNKGTTKTPAEGEEWLGGPFASVLATQYYIKSLTNDDDLVEKKYNSEENSYKVFPNSFTERITFPFIDAKVIFNKSMSFEDINKYLYSLLENKKEIIDHEDIFVFYKKTEIGTQYFITYKNYISKNNASEACDLLTIVKSCIILNLQN